MSDKLKDLFFTKAFISALGDSIQRIYPEFDKAEFVRLVHDESWESRELKQRMRHVSRCLHETLPKEYPKALAILMQVVSSFQSFDGMIFPDYVECYGLDDWDLSLPALAHFTKYASAEFAIRPFLARDPDRALVFMRVWANDSDPHLRRLASEGCRPRLPWAVALPAFKQDPSPILPILETLKDDESESVRKSVANNLNDISKDHPDLVLDICERWYGHTKNTDWIIKHASRSLLKAGNVRALRLFGFGEPTRVSVESLTLDRTTISIGEALYYTFELSLETTEVCKVRLELVVYYVKAKGKKSRKTFQIKEASYEPGRYVVARKHSFEDRSTRKHYPGVHQIAIVVNGVEKATASFNLVENSSGQS
jgi:3-methyladenine DNA glycosylase AlkC